MQLYGEVEMTFNFTFEDLIDIKQTEKNRKNKPLTNDLSPPPQPPPPSSPLSILHISAGHRHFLSFSTSVLRKVHSFQLSLYFPSTVLLSSYPPVQIQLAKFAFAPLDHPDNPMEQPDEKMAALKKVYAEIILNMAKESTSQILLAESKAIRFQQNLKDSKDEALKTIVRLKNIMDAKISEANTVCFVQKRRIHELESQLDEAEHIIECLRTKLKREHGGIEERNFFTPEKIHVQTRDQDICLEDVKVEKNPVVDSLKCCVISESNNILSLDTNTSTKKSHSYGDFCSAISENSLDLKCLGKSSPEDDGSGNPDLASFTISVKEPELYKNGCTQRIRALDQSATPAKVPRGQTDRLYNKIVRIVCKKEETGCTSDSCERENVVDSNGTTRVPSRNENTEVEITNSFFQYASGKSRTGSASCTSNKDSADHGPSNSTVIVDGNNHKTLSAQFSEKYGMELIECRSASSVCCTLKNESSDTDMKSSEIYLCTETLSDIDKDSEPPGQSGTNSKVPTVKDVHNAEARNLLLNNGTPPGLIQSSTRILNGSTCEKKMEISDVTLENVDKKSQRTPEPSGLTKTTGDRLLKYTFQRKRMRGTSVSASENTHPEITNTLKRKTCDTVSPSPEAQQLKLVKASSRENRRIAQVARQLVSLSEKRW